MKKQQPIPQPAAVTSAVFVAGTPWVEDTPAWVIGDLRQLAEHIVDVSAQNSVSLEYFDLGFPIEGDLLEFLKWILEVTEPRTKLPIQVGKGGCFVRCSTQRPPL